MKKQKEKTKKVRNVVGQKITISIPQRKSLKEMIEYEIYETMGVDKEEIRLLDEIEKLGKILDETITVKEKDLVDKIVDLWGEVRYNNRKRFYDAFWEVISEWHK